MVEGDIQRVPCYAENVPQYVAIRGGLSPYWRRPDPDACESVGAAGIGVFRLWELAKRGYGVFSILSLLAFA